MRWPRLVLAFVLVLARQGSAAEIRGVVRCETRRAPTTVTIVGWTPTKGTSRVLRTITRTEDAFKLSVPDNTPPQESLSLVVERPGCRTVIKPLLGNHDVGFILMPPEPDAPAPFIVRGVVQDPGGSPVASANVSVLAIRFDEFSMSPYVFSLQGDGERVTNLLTDHEGRFELRLRGVAPDPHDEGYALHLLVTHDRWPPIMTPIRPTVSEPYVVRLKRDAVHLQGMVVDTAGEAIPDAPLLAVSTDPMTSTILETRTSADGRFELNLPRQGDIHLTVNHELFPPKALRVEDTAKELRVVLDPPLRVKGRVIRESDAAAIASAHVKTVVLAGVFRIARTSTTDETGHFELQGLPADRVGTEVTAEADGYLPSEVDWDVITEPDSKNALRPITLFLGLKWTLEILDPHGDMLRDVIVSVLEGLHGPDLQVQRTDAEGRAVHVVAAGEYVVRVSGSPYPDHYQTIRVTGDRKDRIQLSASAAIRGRVRWSDYTPASGIKLKCLPAIPDAESPGAFDILPDQRSLMTDDEGTFSADRLAPGAYILQLDASESVSRSLDSSTWPEHVLLMPGALLEVDAVLPKPSPIIFVFEGEPVPERFEVRLTEVDDDDEVVNEFSPVSLDVVNGRAELTEFIAGRYVVEVGSIGDGTAQDGIVEPQTLEIPEGGTTVTLKVDRGKAVSGLVTRDDGVVAEGATATIWLDRGNEVSFGASPDDLTLAEILTDAQGRFTTRPLREGRYVALVTMDGFAPAVATLNITKDWTPAPLSMLLSRGSPLRVDIVNKDGAPLTDFIATLVLLQPLPGGRSFQGVQQECEPIPTGCTFDNVTRGLYSLRVVVEEESREFPLVITSQSLVRITYSQ